MHREPARRTLPVEQALPLIEKAHWYHSFEILPGIFTSGSVGVDARSLFDLFLGPDLSGKRALEIGTWDGCHAFELESRGAEVVAIDVHDPDVTAFNTAKKILDSRVEYVRTSIYHIGRNVEGKFDVVVFLGVFYHLKNPILALEAICDVLTDDGRLVFEGECLSHHAQGLSGRKSFWYRPMVCLLARSDLPLALCYPGVHYKGKCIPSPTCLRSWTAAAGLRVEVLYTSSRPPRRWRQGRIELLKRPFRFWYHMVFGDHQRAFGTAVKDDQGPPEEYPVGEPVGKINSVNKGPDGS
ncbi:class I SAM-dependent methyltransferase [Acidobacteriota bacterium]